VVGKGLFQLHEELMRPDKRRLPRPLWVQLGLGGLPTRGAALAFFWLCIGLAIALFCVSMGLAIGGIFSADWIALLVAGIAVLFAALWYGSAIRWVDEYDQWN
jgi:hypothetical protein